MNSSTEQPTLSARGLVKRYGRVTAIDGADFDLYPGEVLAVVGDNGAGKSSLIKALSGALVPDEGEIQVDGEAVHFRTPIDARKFGIETVYQDLAVAPALDIASNMFLGREKRRSGPFGLIRKLDTATMRTEAQRILDELGIQVKSITQPVETLSGGQRQGVAVARAAAFGTKAVIMDEPTAALGVAESGKVLALIDRIRERGLPVVLISHNMPHVFEIADRIHVHRLGRRVAVVSPKTHTMNQVVGLITGALRIGENGEVEEVPAAVRAGLSG
ncbi:ATP-binding cassette domain-containing protein [Amycolatopsis lurida]